MGSSLSNKITKSITSSIMRVDSSVPVVCECLVDTDGNELTDTDGNTLVYTV